ncbi:hypothetical protein Cadr_000013636 [Camelus dromedarius]|uniref:Uncharacterized protein n=1 Tax=Camelus dromedarius TaxID=9838 RepID=A0A5N4DC51_CAMDR|nr:hypothetical protein Cadr_000013636 [Camelus dromedarius]
MTAGSGAHGPMPGPGPKAGQGELFWERAPAPQLTTLGNEGSVPASGGGDGRPEASPCPEKSCGLPQPGRTPPWLKAGPTVLKPQASCRAERASLLGLEYSSSLRGSTEAQPSPEMMHPLRPEVPSAASYRAPFLGPWAWALPGEQWMEKSGSEPTLRDLQQGKAPDHARSVLPARTTQLAGRTGAICLHNPAAYHPGPRQRSTRHRRRGRIHSGQRRNRGNSLTEAPGMPEALQEPGTQCQEALVPLLLFHPSGALRPHCRKTQAGAKPEEAQTPVAVASQTLLEDPVQALGQDVCLLVALTALLPALWHLFHPIVGASNGPSHGGNGVRVPTKIRLHAAQEAVDGGGHRVKGSNAVPCGEVRLWGLDHPPPTPTQEGAMLTACQGPYRSRLWCQGSSGESATPGSPPTPEPKGCYPPSSDTTSSLVTESCSRSSPIFFSRLEYGRSSMPNLCVRGEISGKSEPAGRRWKAGGKAVRQGEAGCEQANTRDRPRCEPAVLFFGTQRALKHSQGQGLLPTPPWDNVTPPACTLTNTLPACLHPTYSLPGIRHGLGITLQLFHVAQELFKEVITGRLTLQSQVHSQGLQDGTVVTQGGGMCQLGREPGKLGQRQWRQRPAGSAQKPACPDYLLHILDAAIGQGDASYPHGAPVAIGAFPIKLGPGRLKDITALGAQELLEDSDHSSTITSVRVFPVLLSEPRGEKGIRQTLKDACQGWEGRTRLVWGLKDSVPATLSLLAWKAAAALESVLPRKSLLWSRGAVTLPTWSASLQDHAPHLPPWPAGTAPAPWPWLCRLCSTTLLQGQGGGPEIKL